MVQGTEVRTTGVIPTYINSHFDEIVEQFRIYTETIQPLIIHIEELKSEFPSEILNEVRAMYTHFSRAFLTDTEEDVVSNIEKIKRHTKRALLDCFKNSCIIIIDQRKLFFEKYKGIDLTYIDKGEFLKKEKTAFRECVDALKEAKKAEGLNTNEDVLFSMYQDAYAKGLILDEIINNAEDDANFLKRKATRRDIITAVFGVAGIIGTIITIIGFILG